jgi:hypothetical protein
MDTAARSAFADRLSPSDVLFAGTGLLLQAVLVVHFALRTWFFDTAMDLGWIVYALAVPAVVVSVVLIRSGRPWYLWVAGFLYAAWAAFGYCVDIAGPVEWRAPILWPVLVPYVALYLSAQMFYWWPLGRLGPTGRRLWFAYAVLFVVSTGLNLASHP